MFKCRTIAGTGFFSAPRPLDANKPTLVFIHGAAGHKGCWRFQLDGLSGTANTVALDLPGHGDSPGPGEKTIEAYAGAVRSFVNALEPPEPVVCGLSMGGAIALHLLVRFQDLFRGAVLVNTGAKLKVAPPVFKTIRENYRDFIEMTAVFGISPNSDAGEMWDLIRDSLTCRPDVALNDFNACNEFDMTRHLDRIRVPVLVAAAADDQVTPVRTSEYLNRNIRGSRMKVIRRAGHFSPIERPGALNHAIKEFLKQI